jgi:hypothetical protein
MIRLTQIRLPLEHPPDALRQAARRLLGIDDAALREVRVFRRGMDARGRRGAHFVYTLDCAVEGEDGVLARLPGVLPTPDTTWRPPHVFDRAPDPPPVVVGAGPCGLLCALALAEMGLRPVIVDQGKPVRERTKDTWRLWRHSVLTPESNVQFGEGGAGTFSDGKLYSQISDPRHRGRKVLEVFVRAGAPEEILYVSKPHVGTFRLVSMVERIRARIEAMGGRYLWRTKVTGLDLDSARRVRGLLLADGAVLPATHVVLAPGHSARDTFAALHAQGVAMEAKPFSIGVRIEHPQSLVDRARLGRLAGHPLLGAADYRLVHHATNGRGVYSFCMCPGGRVVAAASEPGGVVTNGMSQYSRAEFNANAGLVVGVTPADYQGGPLAGIDFQRRWERAAFIAGGGTYAAPAQRVADFLAGRPSVSLGAVRPSYQPGVVPADLSTCLPDFAVAAMREAIPAMARDLPGFDLDDAVMTGVETRTSSPLRLPRGDTLESVNTPGLFPAGEGAGYAGGILSAAVDGLRVAEAVALRLLGRPVPRERHDALGDKPYG